MSDDRAQEYFTDGMVEEIITALSRMRWLFVIARNSSFTYKGRTVDVKQVGRELGVRYVLQGSVRKAANRIRITGQLIDTSTGTHLWADRFDGDLEDVFALQDRVASSVVGAIAPKLERAEIERAKRKPTESLGAYDFYLRALSNVHKYTKDSMGAAIALLKQALAIDPSYTPAAAMIGWCCSLRRAQSWGSVGETEAAAVAEGVRLARAAIEAGKDDPDALWMAAYTISLFCGEHAIAASAVDRALRLNPNSAHAWMVRGYVSCRQDLPDLAIEAFQRASRLSPLDPLGYIISAGLSIAYLTARQYEEAAEWADRSLREQPRYSPAIRYKMVSLAHIGRIDEAHESLVQLLALQPGTTMAGERAMYRLIFPPQTLARYLEGLGKAGLRPE